VAVPNVAGTVIFAAQLNLFERTAALGRFKQNESYFRGMPGEDGKVDSPACKGSALGQSPSVFDSKFSEGHTGIIALYFEKYNIFVVRFC